MKYINIPGTELSVSNVAMGCMRIAGMQPSDLAKLIGTAIERGVNFFDHADIYGGGESERNFARAYNMKGSDREKIIVQSKCGIRSGMYDFSKEHILNSVDGILERLSTDYLDVLLLHRPDALCEPEEVAEAFTKLHDSGKVRYFGVSNHNPAQIQLLQKYVPYKLLFDQLQFSIAHTPMIDEGMAVNMNIDQSVNRTDSVIDFCRLNDITIQAWSPMQKGFFGGLFLGDTEKYAELNKVIDRIAEKYGVSPTAVAVGWIARHPANIMTITGTTSVAHMNESCDGASLPLTRAEWYEIYRSAGNMIP